MEELKKLYDELLPWEKTEFCEWIKERDEFEINPYTDLDYVEIPISELHERYTDDELLGECDFDNIIDYVFNRGIEDMVIDMYDGEDLAEYIKKNRPEVASIIASED